MSFCDYCDCKDCQNGNSYLEHAKTSDGKMICDVCYEYEVCQDYPDRKGKGPCLGEERTSCTHRPKIISEWKKYD
jgi:hypothetical protein